MNISTFIVSATSTNETITVDQILNLSRTGLEKGAVILSEAITAYLLFALKAGVETRCLANRVCAATPVWWKEDGQDLASEIGWTALRTLGMLFLGLACLLYLMGFSFRSLWEVAQKSGAWINRATDDGLGLYGPSPMLKNWLSWWSRPTDTEINCDVPELELTGGEVLAWAKSRWPEQLGAN